MVRYNSQRMQQTAQKASFSVIVMKAEIGVLSCTFIGENQCKIIPKLNLYMSVMHYLGFLVVDATNS